MMGPISLSETSVRNYGYSLRDIPEQRRYRDMREGQSSGLSVCGSQNYVSISAVQSTVLGCVTVLNR